MLFKFSARDANGKKIEGKIEAVSNDTAVQIIQNKGLTPLFVVREKETPEYLQSLQRIWEGASQKELMVFFRELATLIEAKVPIVVALRAVGEQSENNYIKTVVREISDDVEDGMPVSESMAKYPETFSTLSINMIKAGEISGSLQSSVVFIADNVEKNYRLTSKIRGALLYPAFVVTAAIIVGFLAVTIILPKLTGLIKEMQVEIPWYTRLLMIFSNFMRDYWWAVLIAAAGGIVGFIYYIKTEAGRKEWDNVKINLPVVGKLYRYIYITRFCNNFSVLLASGIPIVRALMVVGDVVNNSVFKAVILRAADEVKSGGNISTVFTRSDVIPPIVTHIIKIGEETGKMGEVLKSAASFYEQETDNMTKNLSTLIEPVLIILLGFAVGILVFAIILPIYSIADKIA
ncbi:MAG: hypothetical protein A3E91_01475 [Candidatus Moranbacteria bacterium RIFCSPHIGHO2_12_FULL_40_10]|nr:MAG: hypothetical protein A3E91_01475 [Candidatus Moranbacteria bacterium RIFCSPHIGHO2_12_FULL_40_10]